MFKYIKYIAATLLQKKALKINRKYPQHHFGRGTYSSNLKIYSWNEGAKFFIGSYCSIADGVQIYLGGEHNVNWVTTYPFNVFRKAGKHITGHPKTKGDVKIGNDVWIGKEAMILSGVTIGDGAVIAARSIVSKDIEPYAIAGGNPVREIRKRFDDKIIEELLKIRWWEWDIQRIDRALSLLLNNDIYKFINAVNNNEI
jgi:acetyltransferase-like isoleucine patch superfamily enzyme